MMQFLACIFVLCPLISALAFNAPEFTSVAEILGFSPQGWSPRPTEPPQFNKELLKRQSSGLTLIEGPDTVCGYQFGESDAPLGLCGSTETCGFATALGSDGELVCFKSGTNTPRPPWTSCVGGIYTTSCLQDPACSDNPGIIMCPATESYCNVGTFIGLGVEIVWCDYTNYPGTIPISTTYVGEIGRSFTYPLLSTSSTSSTTTSSPSTTISSSSTTTSISPTPAPSKSSPPTGAIVGGVIGGLALIAAIAASIFFCIRYKIGDEGTTNQQNNIQPQNPSEIYPVTTQATFIPHTVPAKLEYQNQYQQPPSQQPQFQQHSPQPQYQQPQPATQPSYNSYPAQQQQSPQAAGGYTEQQQHAQMRQHSAQTFQVEHQTHPLQPNVSQELSSGGYRNSTASTISEPRSPAPPYTGMMPKVPEMSGEPNYYAYPVDDRYEMRS